MASTTSVRPEESGGILKETALFAVTSIAVLTLLRSHNLTAVDGAVRAFRLYGQDGLQFHGSSHMLYPIHVLLWTRAAALLGFNISAPLSFIRVVQEMNCVFAGLCGAMLLGILRSLGVSRAIAWASCAGWIFSRAVIMHATNSAEPLAGLFWSVLALAIVLRACRSGRMWLFTPAGILLALSMASYQSMVLMAVGCGILALIWPWNGTWATGRSLTTAGLLTLSFCAGLLVIIGISYRLQNVTSPSGALHLFFASSDNPVFSGFSFSKTANLLTGLAANVFVCFPAGASLHDITRHFGDWAPRFLLAAVSIVGVYLLLARRYFREEMNSRSDLWRVVLAAFTVLLLALMLNSYWVPLYDKMWLQPLWLLWLTGAIFAQTVRRDSPRLIGFAAGFVVAVVVTNLAIAIQQARAPWPGVEEASRVNSFVGDRDLVVTDWGEMSSVYENMWGRDRAWDFVSATGEYRSHTPDELKRRIAEVRAHQGSVYFLGLLDEQRATWDPFLGARCGVPFDALDDYRQRSKVIASFRTHDSIITLRRFDAE